MTTAALGRVVLVAAGTTLTVGPSSVAELQTGARPLGVGDVLTTPAQSLVVTVDAPAHDRTDGQRAALDELTALSDELGLYD